MSEFHALYSRPMAFATTSSAWPPLHYSRGPAKRINRSHLSQRHIDKPEFVQDCRTVASSVKLLACCLMLTSTCRLPRVPCTLVGTCLHSHAPHYELPEPEASRLRTKNACMDPGADRKWGALPRHATCEFGTCLQSRLFLPLNISVRMAPASGTDHSKGPFSALSNLPARRYVKASGPLCLRNPARDTGAFSLPGHAFKMGRRSGESIVNPCRRNRTRLPISYIRLHPS
jgi:hypothetical protein